jgi:hypothetical protein
MLSAPRVRRFFSRGNFSMRGIKSVFFVSALLTLAACGGGGGGGDNNPPPAPPATQCGADGQCRCGRDGDAAERDGVAGRLGNGRWPGVVVDISVDVSRPGGRDVLG